MSAADVILSLDALEQLLQEAEIDGHAIATWREGHEAAMAAYTDRGPEWPAIQARAHQLAARLDKAAEDLKAQQDAILKELALHARGARALKGYKPA